MTQHGTVGLQWEEPREHRPFLSLLPRRQRGRGSRRSGSCVLRVSHQGIGAAIGADRAVAHHRDRLAGARRGRGGAEPAGAQDVGGRQQAWDQVVGREVRGSDQRAVRQRNAE
jgi:hypothetical protein